MLYNNTWAADNAFKAKSYLLQQPASKEAMSTIASALAANKNGWVQLSAYGVRPSLV